MSIDRSSFWKRINTMHAMSANDKWKEYKRLTKIPSTDPANQKKIKELEQFFKDPVNLMEVDRLNDFEEDDREK